jgi:DNA-binding NarL/FixJ family response regulator
MNKPLTVLLVEDEPLECQAIARYIDATEDVRLVQVTNNANKAIEYTKDYQPDAVILDLELHKGGGNGVFFLKELRKMGSVIFPYILVTTNSTSKATHEQSRELGADFIMVKNQADYSAGSVIEFLRALKVSIQKTRKEKRVSESVMPPAEIKSRRLTWLDTELNALGFNPRAKGRSYLIMGIPLLADDSSLNIIPVIARKYGITENSVDRAIYNAINSAWKHGDPDEIRKRYTASTRSKEGIPSPVQFIHYYANKLRIEKCY